jgi:hypothetical protein
MNSPVIISSERLINVFSVCSIYFRLLSGLIFFLLGLSFITRYRISSSTMCYLFLFHQAALLPSFYGNLLASDRWIYHRESRMATSECCWISVAKNEVMKTISDWTKKYSAKTSVPRRFFDVKTELVLHISRLCMVGTYSIEYWHTCIISLFTYPPA